MEREFARQARWSKGSLCTRRNCVSICRSVAAHHRCFWSLVRQRPTRRVFASTRAITLSIRFVVLKLVPRSANTLSRCSVSVSSRPSSRPGRRLVDLAQVRHEFLQRALGIGVARVRIRGLQFAAPEDLQRFRQIAHHVLALVPLTALHRHVLAEHVAHGRPESLRAVEHHQQAGGRAEATLDQLAQKRRADALVFRICTKPNTRFSPVTVTPRAITTWSSAKDLPSSNRTSQSRSSCRRSWNWRSAWALAPMKRRDTLDLASPNASGTASAAASYSRHESPPSTRRNNPTSRARGVCSCAYVANGTSVPAWTSPHPRYRDRQLLIGEKDRARLRAPARDTHLSIRMLIPGASQRDHFLLQRVLNRAEAQRDQRLNHRQRDGAIVQRRYRLDVRGAAGWCVVRSFRTLPMGGVLCIGARILAGINAAVWRHHPNFN